MRQKTASIICGAPCGEFPPKRFENAVEGLIIAADRGLDYCLAAGITPDIAAGDFDSAKMQVPNNTECVRVPPIKDDTDAFLAAQLAIERGCDDLRFFCALGGRVDHTFANIQMLSGLKKRGVNACLFGDSAKVYLLENEVAKIPKFDGYLSIFSFGEFAKATARGVKYPINEHILTNDFPLGVSNEITEKFAEITAHSGVLLISEEHF